jgi:rhamnosyltransferase
MDVSVLYLTRNAEEYFGQSLEKVFSSDIGAPFEVIVVDSGSTDATLEIAGKYPVRLFHIRSDEFHHGRTRNYAASLSAGDILVYLTQDAVPLDERWMTNLIAPLGGERVAASYGRQIAHNTHIFEQYFLSYMYPEQPAIRSIPGGAGGVRLKDIFFSDVNSAIKRSVWERHRFDEQIVFSEDQEWARRILAEGYEIVYEPRAAVYHSHKYSLKRVFSRNFDSGASLQGLTSDTLLESAGELLRYLSGEARYIAHHGTFRERCGWLPYEACRVLGFLTGLNERFIPRSIKRHLSTQPRHWESAVTTRKR